jgi:hypothetical protein
MGNEEKDVLEKEEDHPVVNEEDGSETQEIILATNREEYEYTYEGFIPHPNIVKGFGDINSTFPERIMKMTEDNNRAEIWKERLEQILPFFITLIGFGTSIYLASINFNEGAIIAALGGISTPIILKIIVNKKNNKAL